MMGVPLQLMIADTIYVNDGIRARGRTFDEAVGFDIKVGVHSIFSQGILQSRMMENTSQ
jgi:hypothetical protein